MPCLWIQYPLDNVSSFIERFSKVDLPYRLMTRMQLFIIRGISSLVASRYSSRLPPKSFGWPINGVRPMRRRLGLLIMLCPFGPLTLLPKTDVVNGAVSFGDAGNCAPSWVNALWMSSYLAWSRCIKLDPITYSRNFWKRTSMTHKLTWFCFQWRFMVSTCTYV